MDGQAEVNIRLAILHDLHALHAHSVEFKQPSRPIAAAFSASSVSSRSPPGVTQRHASAAHTVLLRLRPLFPCACGQATARRDAAMNGWRQNQLQGRPLLLESQPALQPPQGGWLSQAVDFGASQTVVTPRRGVHGLGSVAGVAPPRSGLAPAQGAAPRVAAQPRVLFPGAYRVSTDSSRALRVS
jgi:hypothetical protein